MGRQTKDIEKQLLRAIAQSGLTRYRLAKMSGVSQTALSLFVNGQRSLTLTSAAKLARAMRLELTHVERTEKGKQPWQAS